MDCFITLPERSEKDDLLHSAIEEGDRNISHETSWDLFALGKKKGGGKGNRVV